MDRVGVWWHGSVVVRPIDLLTETQQGWNSPGWGKEGGNINNILFSLSPHPHFLVFTVLIPLSLLFEPLLLSRGKKPTTLSFYLLVMILFPVWPEEQKSAAGWKTWITLFVLGASSHAQCIEITGVQVEWEKEEKRWTVGSQRLWNEWHWVSASYLEELNH